MLESNTSLERIRRSLGSVIKGKEAKIDLLIAAMLAGGHVLIEDVPGLGKTTLAKCLARSVAAGFRRIQFTPDLLPTDVVGGSVYNPGDGTFRLHRGPIFTNILLADEINRASPRTQSSLLEAMAERQVTIEGERHDLPELFMVIATQNPIEFHGTYPLPEAQLDRFLIRIDLGYADADVEKAIMFDQRMHHPLEDVSAVARLEEVLALQHRVREVHVADELADYIIALMRGTREHERVQMGASPRGALGLFRMSQTLALMSGRDHVLPDDVQAAAVPVLAHRIVLETKALYDGTGKQMVVQQVLDAVPVPR